MYDDYGFDEYCDQDAISCSNGDYNTWEENQLFLDEMYERDELDPEDEDFRDDEPDCRFDD